MILIYSHKLTNRLRYIFKTIFTDVLLVPIEFSSEIEFFESFEGAKINYSNSKLNSGLFFQASTLLFENTIEKQNIKTIDFEGNPGFFSVNENSTFPFDPFAASFYLISRYEEYLPHQKDEHGRFLAKKSLAFQNHRTKF